jgi:hypothetical protein
MNFTQKVQEKLYKLAATSGINSVLPGNSNIVEDETVVFHQAEKARFSPESKVLAYFLYLLCSFCSNVM